MKEIYIKLEQDIPLEYNDAVKMLNVEIFSKDFYDIIRYANEYAHKTFHNKGVIFSQIGIDMAPCSVDCAFCRLGVTNFDNTNKMQMKVNDVVKKSVDLINSGANEVFIMSTADYDKKDFLNLGKNVREAIPSDVRMVANTDDFDLDYAQKLLLAGFTGVYHVCRLGENVDTKSTLEERIITLNAIKESGLELYYCVEPIGPEHTSEQIAEEIFRAVNYNVNVMAVMRRVCFENSPMIEKGEISAVEMALICATTILCVKPNRAMGVHEPEIISLISGANQIYAENGSNPRDISKETEKGRGFSVAQAKQMLLDANWML